MKPGSARKIPTLKTARLRLRKLVSDDAPAFFPIHSDKETLKYWSNEPVSDLSEVEKIVEQNLHWVETGTCLYWAIEELEHGKVIGSCTLFTIDDQNQRAEVGYILNREYWGRGLMSEALEAMIEYAFETMKLHRLEADTDPRNAASLALLEKFGFVKEGFFRERWWVHGQWLDSDMLGLLKSDYTAARKSAYARL